MELIKANKTILFPLKISGKSKYIMLKSIVNESNKNITEKYVANLCIQNRLFLIHKLKITH
jgi:hypothetical protein